jgi:hypothetical protein
LTVSSNAAEGTYNTENAKIAGLTLLLTNATNDMNTKKTDWDTKSATKAWTAALKTKMNAYLVTAIADINAATDPSTAKTKADADTA